MLYSLQDHTLKWLLFYDSESFESVDAAGSDTLTYFVNVSLIQSIFYQRQSIHRFPHIHTYVKQVTSTNKELRHSREHLGDMYREHSRIYLPSDCRLCTRSAGNHHQNIPIILPQTFRTHFQDQPISKSSRPRAHTCPPPSTSQSPCDHPSSCPQPQPQSQYPPQEQQSRPAQAK
jgi:hypothetical protein